MTEVGDQVDETETDSSVDSLSEDTFFEACSGDINHLDDSSPETTDQVQLHQSKVIDSPVKVCDPQLIDLADCEISLLQWQKLYLAIIENDSPTVCQILDAGIPVDVSFSQLKHVSGFDIAFADRLSSPIHVACRLNHLDIVKHLIVQNASLTQPTEGEDRTPLAIACLYGSLDCVKELVQAGVPVNEPHSGPSPLILATSCYQPEGSVYLEIARYLLQEGAIVNYADYTGHTALHSAVTKGDTIFTEMLLAYGANMSCSSGKRTEPLNLAINNGYVDNAKLLIKAGFDVNLRCPMTEMTPLHCAVRCDNNLDMILQLLEAGATPLSIDFQYDNMPIFEAARNCDRQMVVFWLFLANGGSPNCFNPINKTPLSVEVTRTNNLLGLEILQKFGANFNGESIMGTTPLWEAVHQRNAKLINFFIHWNVNLDTPSMEVSMYRPITAFQLALELGALQIADLLVEAGCTLRPHWLLAANLPASVKDNAPINPLIEKWMYTPRSLMFHCRKCIRMHIGGNIEQKLKQVNCPTSLRHYLKMS